MKHNSAKKVKFSDVQNINKWLPFSDNEIGIFQMYFVDYLDYFESELSKRDCYLLACLASETQYQMRILKARITGDTNVDVEINNKWILSIIRFKGLVDFIVDQMIEGYEKTSFEQKYQLSLVPYSYFTTSEEIRKSIESDLKLAFK